MDSEIARITRLLEKAFEKSPWYGPSLSSVISEVTPAQANLRAGKSHSIIELVLHMTSWRTFATRRLAGDDKFQVSDDMNFPKPGTWEDAVKRLKQSQEELLAVVKAFPDARLGELVPGASHKYTFYTLLHGIIQHDIYHTGQIQLILKSGM